MSSDEVLRLTGRRSKGRRVRMVSGEGGAVRAGKTRREARDRRREKVDDGLWHLRGFSAVRDVLLEIWLARTGGNIYLFIYRERSKSRPVVLALLDSFILVSFFKIDHNEICRVTSFLVYIVM